MITSALVLRLAALLASVGIAASRLGLVAHELIGHGGATLAVGGSVLEVKLFWFAGGWIRFDIPPGTTPHLIVAMGGLAIELLAGGGLWLATRRPLLRGLGAALLAHACWYLAAGAWHGFGDGTILYHLLGDARYPVALLTGALGCAAAFFGSRVVFGALYSYADHRAGTLAIAVLAAAVVNIVTPIAEVRLRGDQTYGAIMSPERERVVAREYAAWAAAHPATVAEQQAKLDQLEAEHRDVPFKFLLIAALALAAVLGSRASPRRDDARPRLRVPLTLAAASIALVIVIDYAS